MHTNAIDLNLLNETFVRLAVQLLEEVGSKQFIRQDAEQNPRQLVEAMYRLFDLLRAIQADQAEAPDEKPDAERDIHTLGDYGFHLLGDLASIAGGLGLDELSHELEGLSLPLAVWIARQGGILRTLEPVVNAIAIQANSVREPIELERLYQLTGEIQQAAAADIQQDLEKTQSGRPWRILLLNRAIIATRSHRPELIEDAYDNLVRHLPEEAPGFFREGMQQMVALDYPQPVRQVVEKYYNLWSIERTLH
jgi:hypothetical protein